MFKSLRYQTKFFLTQFTLILVVLLIVIIYFSQSLFKQMKQKEAGDFQMIAQKSAGQIDQMFYEMDRMALQVAANPTLVSLFQSLPQQPENYFGQYPLVSQDVKKLLQSYNFKNDGYTRICLYNDADDFVCTSMRAVTDKGIRLFFDQLSFNSVQDYFDQENHFVYYSGVQTDVLSTGNQEPLQYISVVREIKEYSSNASPCGYVEVMEDVAKIEKLLSGLSKDIQVVLKDDKQATQFEYRQDFSQNPTYTLEIPLENAPFTLVVMQDASSMSKTMQNMLAVAVLMTMLFIAISFVFEKWLIRYLTRPLVDLEASLSKITMENPFVKISDDTSLDITVKLENALNTMVEQLTTSMQAEMLSKTSQLNAQYYALQSQMNPHFLHNMLAIISMEAQIGNTDRIGIICEKLSDILRYNSQMSNMQTTIADECKAVSSYLQLMKIRYEDMFVYTIQVDSEVENVQIPRFVLQPICENCFKHGLKNVEPVWIITIQAYREKDMWVLRISDNGSGFKKDVLKRIEDMKRHVDDASLDALLNEMQIGGLSLPNIYKRMKIAYQDSLQFQIENSETGAAITIKGKL